MDKGPLQRLLTTDRDHNVMLKIRAKYHLGQIVRHKKHPFRGVIFDVDPEFANTEEWYESIPMSIRPKKEQPFYHVFAENDQVFYSAYVSQQNLLIDDSNIPVEHPDVPVFFGGFDGASYELLENSKN